ncbi:MAG: 50S ribosomal protein L18 [Chlamydiae bacterium]|nr:50S ribosomal protein L18 [Chlamydiota bacterium]
MENSFYRKKIARQRRTFSVRKKLRGNSASPRMSVNKTNKHLYVQLIDDENGLTLGSFSTMNKEKKLSKSKETAKEIGKKIAEIAKNKNINRVIFDRGRYKYHGLIAELATGAREAGLQF